MGQGMNMTNRTTLALLAGLLGTAALPAQAQTLQSQLAGCLAIPGVLQRLACYDGVAKSAGIAPAARGAMAPARAPQGAMAPAARPAYAAPLAAAPVAVAAAPSFGSEKLASPPVDPTKPNQLNAAISKITLNPFGKFTLVLANGQIWKQLDSDTDTVKGRKSMREAHISRALMGSYDLRFDDSSHVYKVTRIQ